MSLSIAAGFLALSFANLGSSSTSKPKEYLAEPNSDQLGGVLVLHPWWGLNADVMAFCDRLAGAGFTALAPDLFEGKTADTVEAAEALVKAHHAKHAEIAERIREAARQLAQLTGQGQVAVVGFSYGAYYALWLSNEEPDLVRTVVVFYGTGQEEFSQSRSSYLGHFAENDDFEPKECVDALTTLLREAARPATIHTYPGTGHWFFEPSVKPAFDQDAARLAWERTLSFLRESFTGTH